jgi:hypothetical protein
MPHHIRRKGLNVQTDVLILEAEVSSWRQRTHMFSAVIGIIDFGLCPTRSSFHILYQVMYCSVSTLAIIERVLKPDVLSTFMAVQNCSKLVKAFAEHLLPVYIFHGVPTPLDFDGGSSIDAILDAMRTHSTAQRSLDQRH